MMKLQGIDFTASFSKGSQGQLMRRLIDFDGKPKFGEDAWLLGARAHQLLSQLNGEDATERQYYEHATAVEKACDEIFAEIIPFIESGQVSVNIAGAACSPAEIGWSNQDWIWKMEFCLGLLKASKENISTHSLPTDAERSYLWGVFTSLDDAAITAFLGDEESSSKFLLEAAEFLRLVEGKKEVEESAALRLKELDSQRASDHAKAKHAKDPKQQAKELVRQMYFAWQERPSQYPTASAFARAMLDKFPDDLRSEIVVTRWVRAWKNGSK